MAARAALTPLLPPDVVDLVMDHALRATALDARAAHQRAMSTLRRSFIEWVCRWDRVADGWRRKQLLSRKPKKGTPQYASRGHPAIEDRHMAQKLRGEPYDPHRVLMSGIRRLAPYRLYLDP